MSTDTQAIKTENKDIAVFVKIGKDDKIESVTTAQSEASVKKLSAEGSEYQHAGTQTVKFINFGTVEGFLEAIKDEAARLDIINRGTDQKAGQKVRAVLLKINDKEDGLVHNFNTGIIDTLPLLQKPPQRKRKLSDIEKLTALLDAMPGMTAEAKASIIAQAVAANAASNEVDSDEGDEEDVEDELEA